jgi:hypothetical protein
MLKIKFWANFQRILELFTQKIVTKLLKLWVWDPGSEIRKKPIPDPGVKKAPDPGSATLIKREERKCLKEVLLLFRSLQTHCLITRP